MINTHNPASTSLIKLKERYYKALNQYNKGLPWGAMGFYVGDIVLTHDVKNFITWVNAIPNKILLPIPLTQYGIGKPTGHVYFINNSAL